MEFFKLDAPTEEMGHLEQGALGGNPVTPESTDPHLHWDLEEEASRGQLPLSPEGRRQRRSSGSLIWFNFPNGCKIIYSKENNCQITD